MIASLLSAADAAAKAGRITHARQLYQQILKLNPKEISTLQRLAWLEEDHGKLADAVALLQRLNTLRPNDAKILVSLGVCLKKAGANDQALEILRQATIVDPSYSPAFTNLGLLLEEIGDTPAAVETLKKAAGVVHEFHLAAVSGSTPPPISPAEYTVALFDSYADTFDNHLFQTLGYRGPELLAKIVADHGNPKPWDVLDLGCGTGMTAIPFRDTARKITGIDLSPRMLQLAARRIIHGQPVYDTLQQLDIVTALELNNAAFDLILAADVFIYIGDLSPVFRAAAQALKSCGLLAFTTECTDEAVDFQLRQTRRYAHSPQYIERLTKEHQLELVDRRREILRRGEGGTDVPGDVYLLRKPQE